MFTTAPSNLFTEAGANATDSEYTPYEDRLETYLVPVLFALIFVVGVLGNGTLVIVYVRHRGMRNAPNTYIFSLALADLLVILICVPFVSVIYTLESWPWGELICRVSEAAKDVSIGVSVFTLTALSAERYCAIVNPFRKLQIVQVVELLVSVIYTLESWPWGELICRVSEAAKDVSIGVSVFTLTALSAERYCAIVNPFRKLQIVQVVELLVSVIYTLESWPWGELICRASEAAKDVSIGVSVFTLTALSAERYCAIVNSFRKLQLRKLPLVCATIIWATALFFAIPAGLFSNTSTVPVNENVTIVYCTPYPPGWESYNKWMVLAKALIYYALPLVVITFFYSLMAQRLLASTKEMPGALHGGQGEAQAKARKSVACMVLIFAIVFFVCFLPHHAFEMWYHWSPTAQNDYNDWTHALRIVGFCLSFLNSCVNPVALYCVSGVFRQHFNRYLCCRRGTLHPTCSSRLSRTAVCETSFRSTHRHRCNRNPTESVVISNYDYGSTKKKSNIISRNSADGVTIMTIRDTNEFLNGDPEDKRVNS